MEETLDFLRGILTKAVYPLLILGILLFLVVSILQFVQSASGQRKTRLIVASLLPVVVLVFALVPLDAQQSGIELLLVGLGPWWLLVSGLVLGSLGLFVGDLMARRDSEMGLVLYLLFLSALGSFILYCGLEGTLGSLHIFMLGLLLGGGFYIVLFGPPRSAQSRETPSTG